MGRQADLDKSVARIMLHMNDDHADSLLAYAVFYAGMKNAKAAVMSGLTAKGFVLDVTLADGSLSKGVLVRYPTPLKSAGEVRKLAVAMHFAAYNGLGVGFKLRHNFYGNAVRQAWTHMPAKVKYPMAMAVAAVWIVCVKGAKRLLAR